MQKKVPRFFHQKECSNNVYLLCCCKESACNKNIRHRTYKICCHQNSQYRKCEFYLFIAFLVGTEHIKVIGYKARSHYICTECEWDFQV